MRLVPLNLAGRAVGEGLDVYLFLIGMMLLSELAREYGVFNWLSSVAVRSANGSCSRLCLAALTITAAVSIKSRNNPIRLAREISWGTLVLVAGLFIMVDAVESMGALHLTQTWLAAAQRLPTATAALLTGFAAGVGNNLVNNLPLGLLAGGTLQAAHAQGLIVRSVLIGIDLGPNLSVTGSLATILWLLALRKEGLDVSFWRFLKVGILAMPIALLSSLAGAILIQLLLRSDR